MFSVAGTMPMTRAGTPSLPMARMAPTTAAPPAMSCFICSMCSAGLIEMPPLSNVTPLPIRPSTGLPGAPSGSWRMTISRGGSALPRATPCSSPHAEAVDGRLVQHFDADAGAARQRLGLLREQPRVQHVAGRIRQLARAVGRLAQRAPHLDGALQSGRQRRGGR